MGLDVTADSLRSGGPGSFRAVAISGRRVIVSEIGDTRNYEFPAMQKAYLFVIPEPSALLMLCSGLSALSVTWWWRRKRG